MSNASLQTAIAYLAQGNIRINGDVVYTNGNAIFVLHADGKRQQVLCERMIEQVFFVRD
ncbi:MAG TPA: hypothetical protein VF988_08190 [Verrucomicrobiae bacterium]